MSAERDGQNHNVRAQGLFEGLRNDAVAQLDQHLARPSRAVVDRSDKNQSDWLAFQLRLKMIL
ncbi:hypothetical protein [Pseudomonas sp. 65/3-MNA-CIBAN-0223]|jgi:hypothetical protein|uniref:hypothetical protein n=1 Tax=unclassified Pseudomonas TaxID=196821 RepID=UPI00332DD570